jgi:hypothetical protein
MIGKTPGFLFDLSHPEDNPPLSRLIYHNGSLLAMKRPILPDSPEMAEGRVTGTGTSLSEVRQKMYWMRLRLALER